MEHRWNTRASHRCDVAVDCAHCGLFVGHARDIGLGGMFIETEDRELPLHTPIQVVFSLDDGEYRNDFRLSGMVVRQIKGGIGVMFIGTSGDTLAALRRVLYGEAPAQTKLTKRVLWDETRPATVCEHRVVRLALVNDRIQGNRR